VTGEGCTTKDPKDTKDTKDGREFPDLLSVVL
jgi:hypothetical protein